MSDTERGLSRREIVKRGFIFSAGLGAVRLALHTDGAEASAYKYTGEGQDDRVRPVNEVENPGERAVQQELAKGFDSQVVQGGIGAAAGGLSVGLFRRRYAGGYLSRRDALYTGLGIAVGAALGASKVDLNTPLRECAEHPDYCTKQLN